jgi:hypothetical protein
VDVLQLLERIDSPLLAAGLVWLLLELRWLRRAVLRAHERIDRELREIKDQTGKFSTLRN